MIENRLISLDWAMKRLLRSKSNFAILEGFLTELIYKKENENITDKKFKKYLKIEEILESEANQEKDSDKFNRVDIKLKNSDGEIIIVEIQFSSQYDYFQRMLYGVSKTITEHLKLGENYGNIVKVISVNILYFDLGSGEDYIYHGTTAFKGINRDDTLELSTRNKNRFNREKVSDLFPEYYVIRINKFNDIAKNSLDEWIYFLKNEEIENSFKAKGLNEAKEVLDVLKLQPKDRAVYERKEDNRRYKESLFYTAEIKGIEKGKRERDIEIVKSSLEQNIDIDTISLITGLSIKEIQNIDKNNFKGKK